MKREAAKANLFEGSVGLLSCLHLTRCRRHGLILIIDKSDSIVLIGIVANAQGTKIAFSPRELAEVRAGNKTLDHGGSLGAISRQRGARALAIDHFSSLPH